MRPAAAAGSALSWHLTRFGAGLFFAPGVYESADLFLSHRREPRWPAETFASLSPSRARTASDATIRRTNPSATTRIASRCGSTANGARTTQTTRRPASGYSGVAEEPTSEGPEGGDDAALERAALASAPSGGAATPAVNAPGRGPGRFLGFLRASWAEL